MNAAFTTAAGLRTAAFYCAMFGALGATLPFWPVWLEDWGLRPGEVGFYTSLGVATRVVTGLGFPMLADRLDQRRMTVVVLALLSAALFAGHALIETRPVLIVATILVGATMSGVVPLGEALGAGAARAHGFPYAYPRAIGSIAFLIANAVVGALIASFGADAALWWAVAFLLVTAWLARNHPGGGTLKGVRPPGFAEIGRLMVQPTFALFTLAAAFCLSSHSVYYAYGSVHWRTLGISEATIGLLWAVSVGLEVLAMLALGPWLIRRLGPVRALVISGAGGVLRWGVMATDPPADWLWALQALHCLSFVSGHLGAIAFVAAAVPDRYGASAQGAFMGSAGGILAALAMGLSALVYPALGGGTYLIAAAMSATGLALTLLLARRWSGQMLVI